VSRIEKWKHGFITVHEFGLTLESLPPQEYQSIRVDMDRLIKKFLYFPRATIRWHAQR